MATVGSADRLRATATTPVTGRLRPITSEDWLAVAIGFLTLLGVLAGVRPQLPTLSWTAAADLTGKVLTSRNLLNVATLGILLRRGELHHRWAAPVDVGTVTAKGGDLYRMASLLQDRDHAEGCPDG